MDHKCFCVSLFCNRFLKVYDAGDVHIICHTPYTVHVVVALYNAIAIIPKMALINLHNCSIHISILHCHGILHNLMCFK